MKIVSYTVTFNKARVLSISPKVIFISPKVMALSHSLILGQAKRLHELIGSEG